MGLIDGDAHVIETEETWDFLEPHEQKYRPLAVTADHADDRWWNTFWHIDGNIHNRESGDPNLPLPLKNMTDIDGRLQIMDELNIEIQVLYPTLFLQGLPFRFVEGQVAMARAYNRWLADVWSRGRGRLRWIIYAPFMDMDSALAELDFGKANGACGAMIRGIEGDRMVTDPYFFPFYEKAQALDLPICVHVGQGNNVIKDLLFRQDLFYHGVAPVLAAFNGIASKDIPSKFPDLRWGFVEIGSQWVPYLVREAARRHERIHTPGEVRDMATFVREKKLFIACRTDDDLPYVLKYAGDRNLFIGTDFGHEDPAAELDALQTLKTNGEVDRAVIDRILEHNAREFYAL